MAACYQPGEMRQWPGKHAFYGAAQEGAGEGEFARACVGVPLNFRRVKSGFTVIIARIPTVVP